MAKLGFVCEPLAMDETAAARRAGARDGAAGISLRRAEDLTLALIVLAALALRLILIDQPFIDATSWRQTDTAGFARNFFAYNANIFTPDLIWNGPGEQPVGYEFQTTTWLASRLYLLFGEHDWIGRGISVVFGAWKVAAFFLLVRRVWDARAALVAAAILAVIPGEIYVDRSFLPDPVMQSMIVTSAWALVAWLQDRRGVFLGVAAAAGTLGLLTKISGGIVAAPLIYAVAVHEMEARKAGGRGLTAPLLIAGAGVLAIVVGYYAWAMHLASLPPKYVAAGAYWVWVSGLSAFLEKAYFIPALARQLDWFWTLPLALLVVLGLKARPPGGGKTRFFFHIWLAGFGLFYLIAARGLVENPTNLNLANPAAAALAASGLLAIYDAARRGRRNLRTGGAIVVAALAAVFVQQAYSGLRDFAYHPWSRVDRELGLRVHDLAKPGDLLVVSGMTEGDPTAIYYSGLRGWVFPPLSTWGQEVYEPASGAIARLEELRRQGADWYGVVTTQTRDFEKPEFRTYLDRFPSTREGEFTVYDLSAGPTSSAGRP